MPNEAPRSPIAQAAHQILTLTRVAVGQQQKITALEAELAQASARLAAVEVELRRMGRVDDE